MAARYWVTTSDARVRINRAKLASVMAPGGSVYEFVDRQLAPTAVTAARQAAPKRTGRLAASIHSDVRKVNQSSVDLFLRAGGTQETHYALYVHEGTAGPILPDGEYLLTLYADDPFVGDRWEDAVEGGAREYYLAQTGQVQGQDPQPFLADGIVVALRRHGINP